MNILSSMRYLVAINEHKHFGRAALACHITQPALSNALRALEAEFDVVIVHRGRTFSGLTPEGEQVLAAAQRMIHEHQSLQESLKSTADRPAGQLTIGAVPTAMPIAARFAGMLQARYPDILPSVLSLSSSELENRLDSLAIDLGLGYTQRVGLCNAKLHTLPQYVEHYFLLGRAAEPHAVELRVGAAITWQEASKRPLCLLTPEMHNRTIINGAFMKAGCKVKAVIETNSILTMALSVVAGEVCSIMPGALVAAVRGYRELEALPLVSPQVRTPIGFMARTQVRPSRCMQAALDLAQDGHWLRHAATHSGLLGA